MDMGFVALGRMGGNMVTRLIGGGHRIVAHDRSATAVQAATAGGAQGAASLAAVVQALKPPRVVWVMVPAGEPTEAVVRDLGGALERGDILVDGGNTHYKDDVRWARELAPRGVQYVDAGVSGGVWGLEVGYC